jgi:SAM-dependent methyltransferase
VNHDINSTHFEIDDPIVDAFPIMLEAAARCCLPNGNGNDACFAYHRLWPYRRRLRSHTAALDHTDHFVSCFRALAIENDSRRVLVSGSADYGLLAQVLYGYRAEGLEPDVTVLDICEAPLVINRWYAERENAEINTVQSDILDYNGRDSFDVIVTDNFLSRISPAKRQCLLPIWHRLLRSGGKVVTTEGVVVHSPEEGNRGREEKTEEWMKRIWGRAEATDIEALGITIEALEKYVRDYLTAMKFYRLDSEENLRMLFEDNGFSLDELSPAHQKPRPIGAGPRRSRRLNIVATRVD